VPARISVSHGRPAVALTAGRYEVVFLPELGMLGTSLRHEGHELLSLHGGLPAWREGLTTGMPLLHPWANRLGGFDYRFGRTQVRVPRRLVEVDQQGLPIHGTMLGGHRWDVVRIEGRDDGAALVARFEYVESELLEAFPFPHEVEVAVDVSVTDVSVTTSVRPRGRRRVPVAFGWHPYFRLPGTARRDLVLALPARRPVEVDDHQVPTGAEGRRLPAEVVRLGDRTFDDGYRLGRDRSFSLSGGGRTLDVEFDRSYPYAQVYAPKGKRFVAIEPMTAPADALRSGNHPVVDPGETFTATFRVRAR
jgi:aldose 1-epimerase